MNGSVNGADKSLKLKNMNLSQLMKIIKAEYNKFDIDINNKFNACNALIRMFEEIDIRTEEMDKEAKCTYYDYQSFILRNFNLFHKMHSLTGHKDKDESAKKYACFLTFGTV